MTSEQKRFLGEFVERITPEVTPYLLRKYSLDQVEEILQEAYLTASEEIETLMAHECPNGWFFMVAANRGKRLGSALGAARSRYEELPDREVFIADLKQDTIDDLLTADTPEKDRAVLKLYYEQRLSTAEVAEAMQVTPNNAKQMLKRARDRLKRSMGKTFLFFLIWL